VVPLPEGAREDDVSASYQDGILEVRVPVPEAQPPGQPRVVPIRHT
jgi:HSP20 family protein